jgi:hypothetical protein
MNLTNKMDKTIAKKTNSNVAYDFTYLQINIIYQTPSTPVLLGDVRFAIW